MAKIPEITLKNVRNCPCRENLTFHLKSYFLSQNMTIFGHIMITVFFQTQLILLFKTTYKNNVFNAKRTRHFEFSFYIMGILDKKFCFYSLLFFAFGGGGSAAPSTFTVNAH